MCLLEQIVYLADLTSEDRNYPDIEVMRYKARTSIPVSYTHLDVYKRQSPSCGMSTS